MTRSAWTGLSERRSGGTRRPRVEAPEAAAARHRPSSSAPGWGYYVVRTRRRRRNGFRTDRAASGARSTTTIAIAAGVDGGWPLRASLVHDRDGSPRAYSIATTSPGCRPSKPWAKDLVGRGLAAYER